MIRECETEREREQPAQSSCFSRIRLSTDRLDHPVYITKKEQQHRCYQQCMKRIHLEAIRLIPPCGGNADEQRRESRIDDVHWIINRFNSPLVDRHVQRVALRLLL